MSSPDAPPVSPRPSLAPAPWGFWKGLLTGAAIEIPAISATVWVLARFGIGNPDASFMQVMRLTTVFAGIAALFTAGGIGRLAAHAAPAGRRRAVWVAARAHAMAGAGLVIIAAIPLGHVPVKATGFIPIAFAGLACGAVCGSLIGLVCGGVAPVGLGDVWTLAKFPTTALRTLLSPEDLVKLGGAVRTRTTRMFEGIFEPAPKPPDPDPAAKADDKDKPAPKADG